MKIMVIADYEEPGLWDYFNHKKTENTDLIISCGDLKPEYLEFLTTVVNCPLLFVRGNHDTRYDDKYPEGCIDIDDKMYDFNGIKIFGLGGSYRYRGGKDMYTEREMQRRIMRLRARLRVDSLRGRDGFDILLTHAPCRGYGDMEDLPHRGFECFNGLLEGYRPGIHCYGHVHQEYGNFSRVREHPSGTLLINACGHFIFDY